MCGILGILSTASLAIELKGFENALSALSHRGPDDRGEYIGQHIWLGHTRLSILDLTSAGHQPMHSADDRYVTVFNGEIYNYRELRDELEKNGESFLSNSDTEVLLSAYRVWGSECVRYFRGMFAFAIWDKLKRQLFISRDRCGEKPFFYSLQNDCLYFSSELKSLIALIGERPELNSEVIDMYLHYQYTPEPFTLIKKIHKLDAGCSAVISLDDWTFRKTRYWSLDLIQPFAALPSEGVDSLVAIQSALEDAVCMTLRSDVPVGIALSGGIDSGVIAAMASKHSSGPLHAFTVGYPGRPPYDERDQAIALANSLGMIIHEVEIPVGEFVDFFPSLVRIMDEPIADPAAFGHYSIPRAASDHGIKVLLSGIGGDELFWGYDWVTKAVLRNEALYQNHGLDALLRWLGRPGVLSFLDGLSRVRGLPDAIRKALVILKKNSISLTPVNQLHVYMMAPDFPDVFSLKSELYGEMMRGIDRENPFIPGGVEACSLKDIPLKINKAIFDTWLVSNCLSLSDRVSMASGVETRLPFLDVNLIELVLNLRMRNSDHHLGQKYLLRNCLKHILPSDVLGRPKSGFRPPVWEWISGVIMAYGERLLNGELCKSGILDRDKIHDQMRSMNSIAWPKLFLLYKLVLLEEWYQSMLEINGK